MDLFDVNSIAKQESRAAARKPRDAVSKCSFRLKFANNIPYKYKTSQTVSVDALGSGMGKW